MRTLFFDIVGRDIPISIDSKCLENGCHYAEVLVATMSGIEYTYDWCKYGLSVSIYLSIYLPTYLPTYLPI